LSEAPRRLAVSPDGRSGVLLGADSRALVQIDLAVGDVRHLAQLPEPGLDLVVTHDQVYVAGPYGSRVWTVDRASGRIGSIRTGPRPIALVRNDLTALPRQAP
jgi:hypothetical protein